MPLIFRKERKDDRTQEKTSQGLEEVEGEKQTKEKERGKKKREGGGGGGYEGCLLLFVTQGGHSQFNDACLHRPVFCQSKASPPRPTGVLSLAWLAGHALASPPSCLVMY